MTILGVHVATPEYALVWADAETIHAKTEESAGFCNKLAVNSLAAMVCVGAGWSSLMADAIKEAMRAPSLDEAVHSMPPMLRRAAERMATQPGADAQGYGRQIVSLVGYSHEASRVVAYELSGGACFQPMLQTRLCVPGVPAFSGFDSERGPGALAQVVSQQMTALRDWAPKITGGTLTIAHVRPGQVVCGPHYDLAASVDLCGAPSPSRRPSGKNALSWAKPLMPEIVATPSLTGPRDRVSASHGSFADAEATRGRVVLGGQSIFHLMAL